ncbi:hypothetical protein AWW68_13045 [Roseivirga spongicola]|uniref:Protein argonaute n=1 Tax=Roseivirga spongicola TaxID=333140 RepID=A0A150X4G3_9BACT|nr:hypothetical protein [Roseivirga spongicola]KYG73611.1 hypothetical protein AWW68_13045 [Roseivirga spongicola]
MEFRHIKEPLLEFGEGLSVCPKDGIATKGTYDRNQVRPVQIKLGVVGKEESVEKVLNWLINSKDYIPGKESKREKPKLFPAFPGFNSQTAFKSEIIYDETYIRNLNNSEFDKIKENSDSVESLISATIDLYLNEIKFLAKNKVADVIICVLPEKFVQGFLESEKDPEKPSANADSTQENDNEYQNGNDAEDEEEHSLETDFRRLFKAKSMKYNILIQIVRDRIVKPSSSMQDPASIAWNLYTALYYKAGGTPWALRKDSASIDCYAGISFYRSRDKKTLQTSIAQIFNEVGKGVILRGEPVEIKSNDRIPHLSEDQAYRLMNRALTEYRDSLRINPQRLVIHKTSNFNEDEIRGFEKAANEHAVYSTDMVTIMRTDLRLFREGMFAPRRGSHLALDSHNHLLYTRGSVDFFETYPAKYIPSPILVRLFKYDSSPNKICEEILALTKMNWNNTQFDRKYPITIECARKVGDILKYLNEDEKEQLKYSFYM